MKSPFFAFLVGCAVLVAVSICADFDRPPLRPVACESTYPRHLQGVCTNGRDAIYWSWTEALVKTDFEGHVLKEVMAADHHGDLCHHDGRIYVAVNLGKFNQPAGKADSWVFVYDAESLAEVARHPVQEAVHGAGAIACLDGKFFVVGGLPDDVNENYIYEYDSNFKFLGRHVLASGHTHLGIQTVAFAECSWWFGCYGSPKVLLRADVEFKPTGRWEFDASYGIVPLGDGKFLIGQNKGAKGRENHGSLILARADESSGMVLESPSVQTK